jgi:hypothetical protein
MGYRRPLRLVELSPHQKRQIHLENLHNYMHMLRFPTNQAQLGLPRFDSRPHRLDALQRHQLLTPAE